MMPLTVLYLFFRFLLISFLSWSNFILLTAAKVLRIRTCEYRVFSKSSVAWRMTHLLEYDDIPGVQNLKMEA